MSASPTPRLVLLALGSWLVLGACGYRLLGAGAPAGQPLWLAPVVDDGAEPLFGALLAQSLARAVGVQPGLRLAAEERAVRRLTVRVVRVRETGVAFTVGDRVQEYVVTAELEWQLAGADGALLWQGRDLSGAREFPAGATAAATERHKREALQRLTQDLAREVLRRVLAVDG